MKNSIFKFCFFSIVLLSVILIFSMRDLYSQETKIRIIRKDATLRLKPDTESLIIKKLPLGAELNVEETIGEWFKVKLPPDEDGIVITGYIHSSFVELKIKPTQTKKEIKPITIEPPKKAELSEIGNQEGYIKWMKEYTKAKATLIMGERIRAAGIFSFFVSAALYFLDKEEVTKQGSFGFTYTEKENKKYYLITGGVATIISIVGFIISEPARGEVKALELEAAKKGYIQASLTPIKGGIAFQLTFSF